MGQCIENVLKNKAQTVIATAMLVALAPGHVWAQSEMLTGTVSARVQNHFTLAETTALSFGTFVAIADTVGANTATYTIAATGGAPTASNNGPAKFIIVDSSGASNGVFDVTNAAPNTTLNVSTVDHNATCGACTVGNPVINLVTTPQTATVTTNGTGAATVNVGATLTTIASPPQQYEDGTYSASFDVVVAY